MVLMLAMVLTISAQKKAKYVFYFITDGTGVNTVLGAEMYNARCRDTSAGRLSA